MTRRTPSEVVAENILDAATLRGADPATLAEATDIPLPDENGHLPRGASLSIRDLVNAGGFLRIHPAQFLKGTSA